MPVVGKNNQWCAYLTSKPISFTAAQIAAGTNLQVINDGACILGGVILRAGAADTIVRLFNQKASPLDATKEVPGTRAVIYDGFSNTPIYMDTGLIVSVDQADAIAWVLYDPL